jgi:Na+-driven multidrug efflux pump
MAPFWALFAGVMVIQGAFRGAGNTREAMVLSFLSRWVFRVPVALVLAFSWSVAIPGTGLAVVAFGWGVEGIWLAFALGMIASFVIAVGWFRLGTWTEQVIDDSSEDRATRAEGTDSAADDESDAEFVDD